MSYQPKLKCNGLDIMVESILELETPEECYRFLEDICTNNELKQLAQRVLVAKLLDQGVSYQIIMEQTHASTTTIGRVSQSLQYGSGGYDVVFERLKNKKKHG